MKIQLKGKMLVGTCVAILTAQGFAQNAIPTENVYVISPPGDKENYWVSISSGIENPASYRKVSSTSDLPKTKNEEGQWIYDGSQVRSSTPLIDPSYVGPPASGLASTGPWAVACKRDPITRVMTVESAVKWIDSKQSPIPPGWFGFQGQLGLVTANTWGFSSQTNYDWTLTGGVWREDPSNAIESKQSAIDLSSFGRGESADSYYPWGLRLGSQPLGSDLIRNSTIKVVATELDSSKPAVVLKNHYNVNWHLELENKQPMGLVDSGTAYDEGASDWVGFNMPITVTLKPKHIGWTIAGGGAAIGGLVFAEFPLVSLAFGAADLIITSGEPPAVGFTRAFGYGDYAAAITRQYDINTGTASASTNHWRVAPSNFANAAYLTLTDSAHVDDDDTYHANSGSISGKIIIARPYEWKAWKADTYDGLGYKGLVSYQTYEEGAPEYVSLVRIGTAPLPPPTPGPTPIPTPTPSP